MVMAVHHTTDHSVGELVKQASEQLSDLVRQELRLAQAELAQKGRRAGRGGGLFGGAGVTAFVALQALVAAAIAALALVIDIWAACLVVAGALFAIAAVLALLGRKEIGGAVPPAPEKAIASMKADVHEIKERAHR
jgi:hypothetical protein